MELLLLSFLLCLLPPNIVHGSPQPFPITAAPLAGKHLLPRQSDTPVARICGYNNADTAQPWTAPSDSKCVVDMTASYFGFCNTLVAEISNCASLASACVDAHTCSDGCGMTSVSSAFTSICTDSNGPGDFCYTNLLVAGPSSTYTYFNCDTSYRLSVYSPAAGLLAISPTTPQSVSSTPTPTITPSTAPTPPPSSSPNNAGAIAGGVVGGLAVISMAGLGFFFIRRKTQLQRTNINEHPDVDPPEYYAQPPLKYAQIHTNELPAHVPVSELAGPPPREMETERSTTLSLSVVTRS